MKPQKGEEINSFSPIQEKKIPVEELGETP
jgi:hypothetical protein